MQLFIGANIPSFWSWFSQVIFYFIFSISVLASSVQASAEEGTVSDGRAGGNTSLTSSATSAADHSKMNRVQSTIQFLNRIKDPLGNALNPEAISPSAKKALGHLETCEKSAKRAATVCLETFSPTIKEVTPFISIFTTTLSAAKGMRDKCEEANKSFEAIKAAMLTYQTLCGASLISCNTRCTQVKSSLGRVSGEVDSYIRAQPNPAASAAAVSQGNTVKELTAKTEGEIESLIAGCAGYREHLAAAAAGIAQTLIAISNSKDCADKTTADEVNKCVANPNLPECVNCTKPEYHTHPTCICAQNPRAAGCSSASQDRISVPNQEGFSLSDGNSGGLGTIGSSASGKTADEGGGTPGFGNPLAAGAGGGGLGGGMGGFMGGVGGPPQPSAAGGDNSQNNGRGINTDVVSGDVAGGGGGGNRSSFSGSDNPYNRFLPSPDADANSAVANRAVASVKDQVTGRNGLSNFEKIRRRYLENRTTLLSR